jgi:hypothetical protein
VRYMLIHCVDESVVGHGTLDADTADSLASWVAEMTGRGVLLNGDRLLPTSDATTIRLRGEQLLITDGPFAETKEQVAGYDLIECADLGEAIEIASRHPTAKLGTIELRPIIAP